MSRLLLTDKYDKNKTIVETDKFIIAKGGDGTLLRAIYDFADLGKPFFGSAAGTVNFLMNKEDAPIEGAVIKDLRRIKVIIEYTKDNFEKDVQNYFDNTESKQTVFYAFNDVCISDEGGMNAWIDFEIEEKDCIFGNIQGGGLIISTPQGSTGINKTNQGTILPLSSNQWSITGDKTTRNVDCVVKPRKTVITPHSRKSIIVWIDGDKAIIKNVKTITIEKGDKVQVIFNNYNEFKVKRRV
jgi:NAD kinase